MGNITTDFVTTTKRIVAEVRSVLTTLHLIREDVKVIRDQVVNDADKSRASQQPNDSNTDKQPATDGSNGLDGDKSKDETNNANDQKEPYFKSLIRQAKRDVRKPQFIVEVVALLGLIAYTCETRRTNNIAEKQWNNAQDTLRISQRSYVTLGRKDGIVAEFRNTHGATQDGLVIYFQNSGHIPARLNWGLHNWFIEHGQSSNLTPYVPMSRSRNKKTGAVSEDSSTDSGNIGGDSAREVAVTYFSPSFVDSLIKDNSVFMANGVYEYCDEMGTYSCKEFKLAYQHQPFDSFRVMLENYCFEGTYRPKLGPDDEPLPLCSSKGNPGFDTPPKK